MVQKYSEPIVGDAPPDARRISLFFDKKAVFNFFSTGEEDGIQGDFDGLVACNFDDPVSFRWFEEIWKNEFPHLYTESDTPQCPECFEYDQEMKKAHADKDPVKVAIDREKKEKHIKCAHELFVISKNAQTRSKVFSQQASIVIDNMASKAIPKRKKECADAWSKDKLTLHIGATFFDHENKAHYFIYPELLSESSNTITSQLASSLKYLKKSKPNASVVTITFDNHSTQKCITVIAFLELQAKNGYFGTPGGYFHVVFLVRGHTKNHLDAANSKVSQAYYSAKLLELPSDLVNYIVLASTNNLGFTH